MKLEQQFIYPRNNSIRNAYVAFLVEMYTQKKIRFTLDESISIRIKSRNKYDDSKPSDYGRALGKNGTDAQKILRSLHPFVIPVTVELFESCVYGQNKERITDFADFYSLCEFDIHMSKQEPTHDELVYTPWNGGVSHSSADSQSDSSIQEDVDRVMSSTISTDDKTEFGVMTKLKCSNDEDINSISDSSALAG